MCRTFSYIALCVAWLDRSAPVGIHRGKIRYRAFDGRIHSSYLFARWYLSVPLLWFSVVALPIERGIISVSAHNRMLMKSHPWWVLSIACSSSDISMSYRSTCIPGHMGVLSNFLRYSVHCRNSTMLRKQVRKEPSRRHVFSTCFAST